MSHAHDDDDDVMEISCLKCENNQRTCHISKHNKENSIDQRSDKFSRARAGAVADAVWHTVHRWNEIDTSIFDQFVGKWCIDT